MSRTDLVSDALTIIRNAQQVKKEEVVVPFSNLIAEVLRILKDNGYIENYRLITIENHKEIKVYLKYKDKNPAITRLKKVSTCGRRVYVDKDHIPQVRNGYGLAVISTSLGVMNQDEAKEKGVGGEVICYVW